MEEGGWVVIQSRHPKCEEARKQTMAIGSKGQGGLIMRILRRQLMILVMMVLRMRP